MKFAVRKALEVLAREHPLIVEIVRRRTMKLVRAGSGGKCRYQSGGAAVLHRKGVDLNAGLLDGVGRGRQIQHALANSAGYVEAVDHVLIVIRALTVGAG